MAGQEVRSGAQLKLVGATLSRPVHLCFYCQLVREPTLPRLRQLKKLTGGSWGLEERQLQTTTRLYTRSVTESVLCQYAVSQSTQRWPCGPQLPRARRVVRAEDTQSGQDYNRPLALNSAHAVMAETELKPETAPEDPGDPEDPEVLEDPEDLAMDYWPRRRQVAETSSTHRLESVTGWREVQVRGLAGRWDRPPIEPPLSDRASPPPRERWLRAPTSASACLSERDNRTPQQK